MSSDHERRSALSPRCSKNSAEATRQVQDRAAHQRAGARPSSEPSEMTRPTLAKNSSRSSATSKSASCKRHSGKAVETTGRVERHVVHDFRRTGGAVKGMIDEVRNQTDVERRVVAADLGLGLPAENMNVGSRDGPSIRLIPKLARSRFLRTADEYDRTLGEFGRQAVEQIPIEPIPQRADEAEIRPRQPRQVVGRGGGKIERSRRDRRFGSAVGQVDDPVAHLGNAARQLLRATRRAKEREIRLTDDPSFQAADRLARDDQ